MLLPNSYLRTKEERLEKTRPLAFAQKTQHNKIMNQSSSVGECQPPRPFVGEKVYAWF